MDDEELDAGEVIAALQGVIAGQALEIAKAQAIINNRNRTIAAQQHVIDVYEQQPAAG